MRLWRIVAIATAVEAAALAALAAVGGLAGAWSEWLDVLNVLAPLWALAGLAAAVAAVSLIPSGRARALTLALAAVAVTAAGVRVVPELAAALRSPGPAAGAPALSLLNLNAWDHNIAAEATIETILAVGADVVTLQERGGIGRALPGLAAAYPYATQCPGRAGWGLIVLSRLPALDQGCLGGPGPRRGPQDIEAVWLRVTARDGRPATVVTTHIGWPMPPGRQSVQSQAFADYVGRLDSAELIVTGDFNMAPWTWAMGRQDRRLRPLIRRTRAFPTWPARLPRLEVRMPAPFLPIDHLYAGPAWRVAELKRVRTPGSDHFAIRAAFSR